MELEIIRQSQMAGLPVLLPGQIPVLDGLAQVIVKETAES